MNEKIKPIIGNIGHFFGQWLALSIISSSLYWLLWLIVGKIDLAPEESILGILSLDFAYCALLSLCAIAVCNGFSKLFSHWMERRWAFLVASVGSLVINILLAYLLEIANNCILGIEGTDPEIIEGIYVCAIIATMLSIILLSESHWQMFINEQRERRISQQLVLSQKLDIEELQHIVDELRSKQAETPVLDVQSLLTQLGISQKSYCSRFLAPVIDGVTVIDTKDISHITIEGEKLIAYLNDGKSVRMEETSLDTVESLLDPDEFFRANRQYIVSISAIASLSNFFNQTKILHLKGFRELEIKISKDKYSQLRELVNEFRPRI